jgi:26S proteasome regulatory subunit N1
MLARHQICLETDDGELSEIMSNAKLSEHFLYMGKELDALEPKTPEDIFKTHLTENRSTLTQNVDSARKNLASTFVNGFVNAGFGTDKLMTTEGNKWLYKNKDHGMLSAAASLGLIYLWNADEGLNQVDKYLYSSDENVKAGALMAQGIINCGVSNNYSIDLLGPFVEGESRNLRIGAILGLGIAYAGTASKDLKEKLLEIVEDTDESIEIVSFASLALGMTFVGTCDEDICDVLINTMMERDPKTLTDTLARFMALGLGLLFLGKQDSADAALIACQIFDKTISLYTELTILTCAYAGSGNVYKIQQLFKIVGEHSKDEKESKNHIGVGVLGIALIAMGEDLGSKMAVRSFDHVLQYADPVGKRAVPLALGLLNVSNPQLSIMDTLSKLSHDGDVELAQNAIFSLGLIGAGTNNARIGLLLRQLSGFYAKDANTLFVVRIAQGFLCMGKGLLAMSPYYSEKTLLSPSAISGILVLMHSCLDMKNILLGKYHYLLYTLACAIHPRFMVTLNEDLEPLPVSVRVGTAVDIVAQAGRPKTITGFQTHTSPVLLGSDERAELASQKYIPVTSLLEDVVILQVNKDYVEE